MGAPVMAVEEGGLCRAWRRDHRYFCPGCMWRALATVGCDAAGSMAARRWSTAGEAAAGLRDQCSSAAVSRLRALSSFFRYVPMSSRMASRRCATAAASRWLCLPPCSPAGPLRTLRTRPCNWLSGSPSASAAPGTAAATRPTAPATTSAACPRPSTAVARGAEVPPAAVARPASASLLAAATSPAARKAAAAARWRWEVAGSCCCWTAASDSNAAASKGSLSMQRASASCRVARTLPAAPASRQSSAADLPSPRAARQRASCRCASAWRRWAAAPCGAAAAARFSPASAASTAFRTSGPREFSCASERSRRSSAGG
mmetsp:Transcript_25713/g.71953  ORF Transcript_25713/g.71953 Transcript_25713/m.71953 type:complete len:317 (+) Transcript_25713:258-1208(+)